MDKWTSGQVGTVIFKACEPRQRRERTRFPSGELFEVLNCPWHGVPIQTKDNPASVLTVYRHVEEHLLRDGKIRLCEGNRSQGSDTECRGGEESGHPCGEGATRELVRRRRSRRRLCLAANWHDRQDGDGLGGATVSDRHRRGRSGTGQLG